ncbi:toll/interleukin-1 receptor domain-containing protein [Micromonospora humida]|uniref:toll/interleukin-1 receptor domain-containing protein n=1 Tax=Micromonospora humida TaxID=2809018 RepID=UPI00366B83FB
MSGPAGIRIFLSYNKADLGWARWIAEVIKESGNTAVFQELDSPPGENFPLWISRELDRADIVLPIFSRHYFVSPWCTTEWTSALNRRRMVPVQVEPCDIPIILRGITRVNLAGKSKTACRDLLLRGLRDPAAGTEIPATHVDQLAQRMLGRWKRVAIGAAILGIFTSGVFIPDPGGNGQDGGEGAGNDLIGGGDGSFF